MSDPVHRTDRPRRAAAPDVRRFREAPEDVFRAVRAATRALCEPLSAEDAVAQSMEDASPAKWHLAHTTWFFETFVLSDQRPFDPAYRVLFNSYYNSVGEQYPRPHRGLLTRPSLEEVLAYREDVEERVVERLRERPQAALGLVEVGLHHEQQHQELILTDLKHLLSCNPLQPVYQEATEKDEAASVTLRWHAIAGGSMRQGHGGEGFAFDNEGPEHRARVEPFELASHPVTNAEYGEFIDDGGYRRPELWLSDGWSEVQRSGWEAPLYWGRHDGRWLHYTLAGSRPPRAEEPVCHVSYYEADAFATWAGARLASEAEWECAAEDAPVEGNFVETRRHHPAPASATSAHQPAQLFGDVWEWTRSAYAPYPRYRAPEGAIGEYNGKFMCNQLVLRGGSCASPESHLRASYRNFFPAAARWQFSGIRLARDV